MSPVSSCTLTTLSYTVTLLDTSLGCTVQPLQRQTVWERAPFQSKTTKFTHSLPTGRDRQELQKICATQHKMNTKEALRSVKLADNRKIDAHQAGCREYEIQCL